MYPDESEIGFLCRTAHLNYRSYKELPFKFPKLIDGKIDEEEVELFLIQISKALEINPTTDNLLYLQFISGLTFPHWRRSGTVYLTRYCPYCLQASIYHRARWSLSHHTCCLNHNVYLLSSCFKCKSEVTIEDITLGFCSKCDHNFSLSLAEKLTDEPTELMNDYQIIESPYLSLLLDNQDQIRLIQRLAYLLTIKCDKAILSSAQKHRLAFGYNDDTKELYSKMSLSYQLLQGWPTTLIFYLMKVFNNSQRDVQNFMSNFIIGTSDKKIKSILLKTLVREKSFSAYGRFDFKEEHIQIDKDYVPIEDVIDKLEINIELISKVESNNIYHPRNRLVLINKNDIPIISQLRDFLFSDNEYIIEYMVLKKLNISLDLLNKMSKILNIHSRDVCGFESYLLSDILQYQEVLVNNISVSDINLKYKWDFKSIIDHLIRSEIKCSYITDKVYEGIYPRKEVIAVFENLDRKILYSRSEVIKILGKKAFEVGLLMRYRNNAGNVYYNKDDVIKLKNLCLSVNNNLREVKKIRERDSFCKNPTFPVTILSQSLQLELMNY
jgi:hypothetical protein